MAATAMQAICAQAGAGSYCKRTAAAEVSEAEDVGQQLRGVHAAAGCWEAEQQATCGGQTGQAAPAGCCRPSQN